MSRRRNDQNDALRKSVCSCTYVPIINIRVCGRTFNMAVCNKNRKSSLNTKDTYVRGLYYVNVAVIGDSPL